MTGFSARLLVARALRGDVVDVSALVAARQACGSWDVLGRLLRAERLAPLLAYRLGERDFPADGNFKEALRSGAREVLAANLVWRKVYEELGDILGAAGIRALPIKGVDVAFTVYPSPACRPMADIDILVSPEDYRGAEEVLEREGFVPLSRVARWWPGRDFTRKGATVDLHWSPAAGVPARRAVASWYFAGDEKTVGDEFRLLVSVCHQQNHFFSLTLLDYYEALLLARRVSWRRYWPLARRWGAARATRFVLAVARSFFGGMSGAGSFNILKTLAGPGLSGTDPGRGARAAAVYALSLDNPAAAFGGGLRRPAWAKEILTRGFRLRSSEDKRKEKVR
ncbi:MAG: hypothetical protein GTN49_10930 [candidate division Zixibacteria bacterium]|nr:hypothetical protein [candidate division Zixibacteria bacterium]